jgi:hypothetical protein
VTEWNGGHSNQGANWHYGYQVGFETSAFAGITQTITNIQVNNWSRSGQNLYYGSGTGNVGIGTTSPGYKLEVNGTTKATSSYHQNVNFTNTPTFQIGTDGFSSGFYVYDSTAAAYRMVVKSSTGNVGIGTLSPGSYNAHGKNLVVAGSGNVGITIDGASSSSCSICFADGTSSTASIAGKIEYDHSSDAMEFRTAAVTRMKLNSTSLIVSGDVVAYGSPSDVRLKENIKPINSALDKVSKLQGVTFDWIQKEDQILDIKEDIGFIAQDVQKVIPELVRENDDGMLSMRHQGVAPILLEAIKELKAEVDSLKEQLKNK